MLLFEYFVYGSNGKTVDPAIYRKVRGIDNAGEEYVGCLSNIMANLDFYKYNLEVAMDKIRKLEYDLKEKSNGTNQVEA
jgi:hypothetical protein